MTTTMTRRPAKTSAPSAKSPSQAQVIKDAFSSVAEALYAASLAEDPECCSGDSNRLLRAGAGIADLAAQLGYNAEQAQDVAFDIAAQIKAARLVRGDTETPERTKLIEAARTHLVRLTGSEECIRPDRVRTTGEEQDATQFNAKQYELILETIAGKTKSLQQLLMILQGTALEDRYAQAVVIDAAEALATMIGALADDAVGGCIHGDARSWHYGPNFATTGKAMQA